MLNIPRQPRQAEVRYVSALRSIFGKAQSIIHQGLEPLLMRWPREISDARTADDYNPLIKPASYKDIRHMSDQELKRLWPNLDPADVREYAPWATSRQEVVRLVGGSLTYPDLGDYVRRAIAAESAMRPRPAPGETFIPSPPGPGAFIARPRSWPPPVVVGTNGFPLVPPQPVSVTTETIKRQFDWIEIALGEVIKEKNIVPVMNRTGRDVNKFVTKESSRVLNISLRQELPGIQNMIDEWRDINVSLIQSAIFKENNSLYADISRTIESAHIEGLRVEVLAQNLIDRYNVSDSRAALIARDQVLKLNGQITRHRQKSAGITHYTWVTSRDERVRETHQELDGTVQSWDAPTEEGHPGSSFACRCTASPKIVESQEEVSNFEKENEKKKQENLKKIEAQKKASIEARNRRRQKLENERKQIEQRRKSEQERKSKLEQRKREQERRERALREAKRAEANRRRQERAKTEARRAAEARRKAEHEARKAAEARRKAEQERQARIAREKAAAAKKKENKVKKLGDFSLLSGSPMSQNVSDKIVNAMKNADVLGINLEGMRDLTLFREATKGLSKSEINSLTTKMTKAPFDTPIKIGFDPDPISGFKAVNLIDGRHRLQAAREAGATHIQALIQQYNKVGDTVGETIAIIPTGGNLFDIKEIDGVRTLVKK